MSFFYKSTLALLLACLPVLVIAQDDSSKTQEKSEEKSEKTPVYQTFKDRRVINAHSLETLAARKLDIRIGHRFGDLFGDAGGWPTFYGLENATDVMIGGEYGVTNRLTTGVYRTKGAGKLKQLINGVVKYKLLQQYEENPNSITATAVGIFTVSTMQKGTNPEAINYFDKASHRMAYTAQLIIGQKFSDNFSLQFTPTYTHRNVVEFGDRNDTYGIGVATRIQLSRVVGLIADVTLPLNGEQSPLTSSGTGVQYYLPLGIGLEFDTGGHIFQLNFTNATGMIENDYIPNTTSSWGEGEFRIGFTISRMFNIR